MTAQRMASASVLVEDLSYAYGSGGGRRTVLNGLSCHVGRGEVVMVTGPSGSGKTTLLSIVGALRGFGQGSVRLDGTELCGLAERELIPLRHRIGFIFQRHNLLRSLSVLANVESGLQTPGGSDRNARRGRARAMLEAVGLGDRCDDHPDDLSGGQQQRVAVARALARMPAVIIADEPTASLDAEAGRVVMEVIRSLANQVGCSVLVSTHDERIFGFADRRIHIGDGRVVRDS